MPQLQKGICASAATAVAATLGSGLSHVCVLKEACPQAHLFLPSTGGCGAPVFGLGRRWLQVESQAVWAMLGAQADVPQLL